MENSIRRDEAGYYRWYVLGVLALTYAFSIMDRQILSILLEDLRLEFTLSDTQLGLLSGLAFALFYSTLGIPIARLADRSSRVNIIAVSVALWSLVTALCGAVTNAVQLFAARVGVGIGEAGGGPPAHSMISDYFAPSERALAISLFSLGTAAGGLFGLVLGGFVAEYYGWRMAFVAAGLPGLLLAVLVKATIKEPPRGHIDQMEPTDFSSVSHGGERFVQTLAALWNNIVYRRVTIGHVLAVFVGYGLLSWLPALYLRQFELGQSAVGTILGLVNVVGGVPGLILGGVLADRLGRKDPRWRARLPALALLLALPVLMAGLWAGSLLMASLLFGLGIFLYQISHGPGLAVVQLVVAPHMRAQAAALVFFFSNMLGLGLGPLLVGYFSDMGAAQLGAYSLRTALSIIMLVLLAASVWYWRTGTAMGNR